MIFSQYSISVLRRSLWLLLPILTFACSLFLVSPEVNSEQVMKHISVSLHTEENGLTPGAPSTLGVLFAPEEHWHIYWKYAGDSGSAPKFKLSIGDTPVPLTIDWPTPKRIPYGSLVNYGYDQPTLVILNFQAPSEIALGDSVPAKLSVEWLVCEENCVPGFAELAKEFSVVPEEVIRPTQDQALFENARELLPSNENIPTIVDSRISEKQFTLRLEDLPAETSHLTFLPDRAGIISNSGVQVFDKSDILDGSLDFHLPLAPMPIPGEVTGLLLHQPGWPDGSLSKQITVPIPKGSVFTPAPPSSNQSRSGDNLQKGHHAPRSLILLLLTAFLGGALLNLMPCVFPVISMKVLGFAKKSGHSERTIRLHALAFCAGIFLSFWVLLSIALFIRSAGTQLGWGFQLQNPVFVSMLYFLLILLAFNLFGVYEVGSTLQRIGGKVDEGSGRLSSSFLTGVLAVVLATPCSAPFMGGAVAYALSSSSWQGFLVFSSLATGLSLPYFVLALKPALLGKLPKPGEWMNLLKQFLGFPLLLTAVWLLWVLEQQQPGSTLNLVLAGLGVGFCAWLFGIFSAPKRPWIFRRIGGGLVLLLGAAVVYWGIPHSENSLTIRRAGLEVDSTGLSWIPYEENTLPQLAHTDAIVFVDFTAAWCVTCQVNKKVVFSSQRVLDKIQFNNVQLVRGDWTRYDAEITKALARFDRASVPLNVVLRGESFVEVLPAVLTPDIVIEALDRAIEAKRIP